MNHSTDPPISDATAEQRGTSLATADPAFNWTRQMRPDLRSLVTLWLETDRRVVSHVTIVPAPGGVS
jgi:hypothetical protein